MQRSVICNRAIFKHALARENREEVQASGAGLAVFSCTNFRAMEIRRQLEEILEMPVLTSNQCLADWVKEL